MNATLTASLLQSIQLPSLNDTNKTATEFFQDTVGITFCVPNNLAFVGVVNQMIAALQNNVTVLTAVLENHVSLHLSLSLIIYSFIIQN